MEEIRRSYNREAWENNRVLKIRLGMLDLKAAEKKLLIVDDDLAESIIRGDLKLPDEALTTPVKLVMRKEEEREVLSPTNRKWRTECELRDEYRENLSRALRNGQVNCLGCLMGVGCEWDGPMGDLLRAHGNCVRAKRPSISNNQIRFGLYRFYVNKRFDKEIEVIKAEGCEDPRIPLPACVEIQIKKRYSGGNVAYVGFRKRKAKIEES
jgi:hypothetical protein